jgi:hypothetical protein
VGLCRVAAADLCDVYFNFQDALGGYGLGQDQRQHYVQGEQIEVDWDGERSWNQLDSFDRAQQSCTKSSSSNTYDEQFG